MCECQACSMNINVDDKKKVSINQRLTLQAKKTQRKLLFQMKKKTCTKKTLLLNLKIDSTKVDQRTKKIMYIKEEMCVVLH